jgi:hypothetical protein
MDGDSAQAVRVRWESQRVGVDEGVLNGFKGLLVPSGTWITKNGLQGTEPRPSVRLGRSAG